MSRGSAQDEEFDSLLQQVARLDDAPLGPRLPRPGYVVGDKYRIEERIGAGGMGAVFRASHVVSHKAVALKWLLRSTSDEHVRARFLREARVAGRVDHPNVVNVYDVGEDGDCGYLVMELLTGEALRARLARGPLPIADAVELLLPAMRGVAAVHDAGVVHRDIKPDNIFLCRGPDGAPREAKVLDFGISAMRARDAEDATLTGDGAVIGTLAYMSPEQLQRARDVDVRTDVYSFGVVLYEALTGRLPFEAYSYPALAMAIAHGQPIRPTERRADLPAALEQVMLRALARAPEARYASVADLMEALAPWASTGGRDAFEAAAAIAGRRRRARAWSLAACALIALGCAAWWLTRSNPGAPPAVARASTPETRPSPAPVRPLAEAAPPVPVPLPALEPSAPATADAQNAKRHTKRVRAPGAIPVADPRTREATHRAEPSDAPRSGMLSVDQL